MGSHALEGCTACQHRSQHCQAAAPPEEGRAWQFCVTPTTARGIAAFSREEAGAGAGSEPFLSQPGARSHLPGLHGATGCRNVGISGAHLRAPHLPPPAAGAGFHCGGSLSLQTLGGSWKQRHTELRGWVRTSTPTPPAAPGAPAQGTADTRRDPTLSCGGRAGPSPVPCPASTHTQLPGLQRWHPRSPEHSHPLLPGTGTSPAGDRDLAPALPGCREGTSAEMLLWSFAQPEQGGRELCWCPTLHPPAPCEWGGRCSAPRGQGSAGTEQQAWSCCRAVPTQLSYVTQPAGQLAL